MIGVQLAYIVAYALLASGVAMWLHARGTGALSSAAILVCLCTVIGVIDLLPRGRAIPTKQAIEAWLIIVLLPSAVVWGLSRQEFLNNREWLLWLLGPVLFVVAMMLFGTAFNVVFGTRRLL